MMYPEGTMAKNPIQLRRKSYFKLSSHIAQIDNAQLRSLFDDSESSAGWGRNHTIDIGHSKVFVKRVPVTDVEYDNMFSTKNLYDLPTYYNYGVGSAGFGVFRELVTHIKTTNWVLEGAIATFPLTYHYRIIPFSGARADVDMERHKRYVEYWGNSPNVGRYMLDRANASYELVLFLEHMPYTLETWLLEHPHKLHRSLNDLRATITFLRKNGIIHFDAHFFNILTDGEQVYLTDFGLALDKSFALTKEEELFFRQNTYYDYGEVLCSLGFLLFRSYDALSESDKRRMVGKYGIKDGIQRHELVSLLLNNIEEIYDDGMMKLDEGYVASIVKYRSIISLMHDFYSDMWRNNKKDTKLRHAKLWRLLKETEFLPATGSNDRGPIQTGRAAACGSAGPRECP
jgi:hypothetical protein